MTHRKDMVSESVRRRLASVAQWGGWTSALGIYTWSVVDYGTNMEHLAPPWAGFTFMLFIGVAIGGTTARARMRLSDTIVDAIKAGMQMTRRKDEEQ